MATETTEQIVARLNGAKAAQEAEREVKLAPFRARAEERRANEAKARADEQVAKDTARQAEVAARFDREHKGPTRSAWIASGGTPSEFDAAWPKLRVDLLAEVTRKRVEKERAESAAAMRKIF